MKKISKTAAQPKPARRTAQPKPAAVDAQPAPLNFPVAEVEGSAAQPVTVSLGGEKVKP